LLAEIGAGCVGRSTESITGPSRSEQSLQTWIFRKVRRLSNREYNNVVRDLLWNNTQPANAFLDDSYANGYDNGSALLTVQTDQAERYQLAAEQLAQQAVNNHLVQLLGGCIPDKPIPGQAVPSPDNSRPGAWGWPCVDRFFETFPQRAFRRPPTADEMARLRGVYRTAAQLGGYPLGIQTTIEAILQSPAFLYREELGVLSEASGEPATLTPYEVASELSFFLTGTMPDDDLLAAASEGRLSTRKDLRREASRLMQTASAQANVRQFFHQWLATNRLATVTKDAAFYPAFNSALAASMSAELDLFFNDVLWNGSGSLRELFTSSTSFADERLGALYGVAGGPGFAPVSLDPEQRKGILTRAGYLTVHSATSHSSPVERGVFLRQALLCTQLPPPPPDVLRLAMMEQPDPSKTTRERFAAHSADPFCHSCHQYIDQVGFGFEEFDAIGAFRTTENGKPVDDSGTLLGTRDADGDFRGVGELSERLLTSRQFQDCVVTQMFRFAMGVAETTDDREILGRISNQFSVDQPLLELVLAIVDSPLFVQRMPEGN
jgi:hypothetical protein